MKMISKQPLRHLGISVRPESLKHGGGANQFRRHYWDTHLMDDTHDDLACRMSHEN